MEKLTLKELAPYLPYGLKVLVTAWDDDSENTPRKHIDTVDSLSEELITLQKHPDYYFNSDMNEIDISIALRPLSDLTKEITHNGETFVPLDVLIEIHGNGLDYSYLVSPKNVKEYSFDIVQSLLEWHFDVFGLIERGLAINVNELEENPYK